MTHDRNSNTSLVIHEMSPISRVDPPNLLCRREFIRRGGKTVLALSIAPLALCNQQAVATPVLPWLAWTGSAALAGGISWLVGRVLDRIFPDFGNNRKAAEQLANELNVKHDFINCGCLYSAKQGFIRQSGNHARV